MMVSVSPLITFANKNPLGHPIALSNEQPKSLIIIVVVVVVNNNSSNSSGRARVPKNTLYRHTKVSRPTADRVCPCRPIISVHDNLIYSTVYAALPRNLHNQKSYEFVTTYTHKYQSLDEDDHHQSSTYQPPRCINRIREPTRIFAQHFHAALDTTIDSLHNNALLYSLLICVAVEIRKFAFGFKNKSTPNRNNNWKLPVVQTFIIPKIGSHSHTTNIIVGHRFSSIHIIIFCAGFHPSPPLLFTTYQHFLLLLFFYHQQLHRNNPHPSPDWLTESD